MMTGRIYQSSRQCLQC